MTSVGIRRLKNELSRYVRRAAAGDHVLVTDRGRVVAALVPPPGQRAGGKPSRYDELKAAGVLRPRQQAGDPLADLPMLRLRRGTAAQLINEDRDES
ncbi:MAG: type II toxin-antitoxin system Phd/YefM family antitoxin [Gemmatimonadaceae bacterium]